MMRDLYDLPLSTASATACDAYLRGAELALTTYPGAVAAFDEAVAADPGFAMAHIAKAQVLMRKGEALAARAAHAQAMAAAAGLTPRERSHLDVFDRMFAGRSVPAVAALEEHLDAWPRDALVVTVAASPNGLIASSGQIGQKRRIAALLDRLAPHYGDDPWFLAQHAMALSENGQLADARPKIEQSVAAKPKNGHAAHAFAHVCYESGDLGAARDFLPAWLAAYPRQGFFHGHVSWHLALCELQAGNWTAAYALFQDAFARDRHSGGPQQQVADAVAFLWRSELAGHPRNDAAWRSMHDYVGEALPRPSTGLADLHTLLAHIVAGDECGLNDRVQQMQVLAEDGRYPSESYLPQLSRGFAAFERGDHDAAIEALVPLAGANERIGGSRAQHDLIEFTLLKAFVNAQRLDEMQDFLRRRRSGASGVPIAGLSMAH